MGKITTYIKTTIKLLIVIALLLCSSIMYAQMPTEFTIHPNKIKTENKQTQNKKQTTSKQKNDHNTETNTPKTGKQTLIHLEQSDIVKFDNENLPDIQVLIGNVILRHDDIFLYCDSAYLNQNTNSFNAFGHIKIQQGDSLKIYSKLLNYNGNTRIAHLYHDVKMINKEVTLYTDTLTYQRPQDLAFYTCGGKLIDSLNTLNSKHGYYNTNTKIAQFKYNVIGTNNTSTIKSDTLKYNTNTRIATILGPTYIYHTDSTTIYSELGYYNSNNDQSQLLQNSNITHQQGKTLTGDTIYYDKQFGIGKAYHNVTIKDTINQISLHGHYAYYKEEGEISIITDSALMIEFSQKDTTYIHADTLYAHSTNENKKQTIAHRNVRLYNNQFQAVCDSLTFNTKDSIIHLMQMPILWNENQQITGDTIHIHPQNKTINKMHIINNAMMIQQEDSIHYNQISGKEITSYIQNNEIDHIDIQGNVQSIFYPNDQGNLIGQNTIKSSYMTIYFKQGKIERFNVFPSPTAVMYPMSHIKENMLYLPNYTWQIETRPISKDDIFRHPTRLTQKEIDDQKQELKNKELQERKNKRKQQNETNTADKQ